MTCGRGLVVAVAAVALLALGWAGKAWLDGEAAQQAAHQRAAAGLDVAARR